MAVPRVEVVVLGLLAEEPLYGYGVLERFRSRAMGSWAAVGKASVYQALRRLEDEGLVAGRAQEGTDGPDRRVFKITRPGRRRLDAGLEERFGDRSPYAGEAGVALGFAHLLSSSAARRGIDAREAAIRALLDVIEAERARIAADPAVSGPMLDREEALARAELAWVGRFRAGLRKR